LSTTPSETPDSEVAAAVEDPKFRRRLLSYVKSALTQQYSFLVFWIVSFIIAQIIVVVLNYRT
jgi:hypothetical protein